MRLLLLSDTHGNLSIVNELAVEVEADAVIHAGDFGFYDDDSYERISDRELRLHITHSGLDAATREEKLSLPASTAPAKTGGALGSDGTYD